MGECFDKLIKSFKVWCETALIQFLIEQYEETSLILSSIKRDFKIRLGLFYSDEGGKWMEDPREKEKTKTGRKSSPYLFT